MLYPSIWIALFTLYGTILAEDESHHYNSPVTNYLSRTRRFGFTALYDLRQYFCHSFCTSADTMPYLLNLFCAVKCPELYLPHHTTIKSTTIENITSSVTANTTTMSKSGQYMNPTVQSTPGTTIENVTSSVTANTTTMSQSGQDMNPTVQSTPGTTRNVTRSVTTTASTTAKTTTTIASTTVT